MGNLDIEGDRPQIHDCKVCSFCQESVGHGWNKCGACKSIFLERLYKDFSSGNKVVDELIKTPIYLPPNGKSGDHYGRVVYYEWIPWERLSNIDKIGEGGFATVYKATYVDGLIDKYSIKCGGEYERRKTNWKEETDNEVAIKFIKPTLKNDELLKELNIQRSMFLKNWGLSFISEVIGLTQNTETQEYGIVMEFAQHGDMRRYMSTNFHSTNWFNKLMIAWSITSGLDQIHSAGMVHRDLHSGNILQFNNSYVRIGDVGLCQPTNHQTTTTTTTGIYGVIPYIPPEVLGGGKFTTAGDIYSLGMLLWELATGKPPFHDRPHDRDLILDIIFNGQRPEITSPLIPPCYAELIKRCWESNPFNRPTAKEVKARLTELQDLYNNRSSNERLQFLESEKYIKQNAENDDLTTKTSRIIHPQAVYSSRPLAMQNIKVYVT
ncbi:hypothetical protein G9A89_023480 [Geosiphon pyriformis]|nr:hypothetical protein G9A89_023480 [Geosiphon pyriformis]